MHSMAFTGLPGSGKSEAVAVGRELGVPVVNMGDEVRKEVQRRDLAPTDMHLGQVATEMRKAYGRDIWAQRTLAHIEQRRTDRVIIDGIRNIEEVETFRHNIDAFFLVAIHASPQSRYHRLKQRGRSDDLESEEALRRRDQRELSWGLGIVIAMADTVIINEGSLSELRHRARDLIQEIKK